MCHITKSIVLNAKNPMKKASSKTPSPPTDKELFFAFCRERGVRPRLLKGSKTIYVLPPSVIEITYFGMKITPPEIQVYFMDDGRWIGGTNWLWDKRLPWVESKRSRKK